MRICLVLACAVLIVGCSSSPVGKWQTDWVPPDVSIDGAKAMRLDVYKHRIWNFYCVDAADRPVETEEDAAIYGHWVPLSRGDISLKAKNAEDWSARAGLADPDTLVLVVQDVGVVEMKRVKHK